MRNISEHQRVNDILLGPLERPALRWLAAHAPPWITPDRCTAVGVVAAFGIMVSYGLSALNPGFLWLATFGYVVNWFGDSLDGTLARHRRIERPIYGFFLDHTVDAITEAMIFLGLGLTPYVRFDIACLALIAYLLLSVLVYVRTSVAGEFRISYGKLGPTEVRVLAIILNTWMYFGGLRSFTLGVWLGRPLVISPYDVFVAGIGLLLLWFFTTTAIRETIALRRQGR
ncbi:MAG TPA: CDP-alcohol phosphatidyltransferase family protein [Anaerolineales bacterium]|nr:CDP-alcohol phosphatidyltransferase family protein [Anaerolineales bacterium]